MFVKPGPRPDDPSRPLVVRKPNGRFLSEVGEEVEPTNFWHRRLRDGDVVEVEPVPVEDGEEVTAGHELDEHTAEQPA